MRSLAWPRPALVLVAALPLGCAAPRTPLGPGGGVRPDALVVSVASPARPATPESAGSGTGQAPEPADSPSSGTPDELPREWRLPVDASITYDDQLRAARQVRTGIDRAPVRGDGGALDVRATFAAAQASAERASGHYAKAANARDADDVGRVIAIAEAAALALDWSRRIDVLGVTIVPASWRTDPALGLTFEDVSQGPAKRWRSEAAALARHCLQVAEESGASPAALAGCREVDALLARVTPAPRGPRGPAQGAGTACACDPGDPLCSASLGPWCASRP